jgi:hypothetical protein
MPRVVVTFSRRSLGALHMALMAHTGRLNRLLEPSWPNAEEMHEEMHALVDTLMVHGVDQKWFSAFALIEGAVEGAEEMVTTPEIRAVSWETLFCGFFGPF